MAALQHIRNYGKILIAVVGLALFAFIAEELVRSLSFTQNEKHQRVGSVCGDKISIQEFNDLVDEYTDVIKFSNGLTNLTDEQMQSIRDQVWNTFVQNKLIEEEADKLGITVTDAELQNIINTGSNQLLMQTPFRTQQGAFDPAALKQFLTQYQEIMGNAQITAEQKEQATQMYNYWKFIEKQIRQQTLMQKYQSLLAGCIISNPVAAKQAYEGRINEADVLVAAVPFTSIDSKGLEATDAEIKAKYEEQKAAFYNPAELREIKYIDVKVSASKGDEKALSADMDGYAASLAAGEEPAKVVREAGSQVAYSSVPVSKKSLPSDIAERLDSIAVGQQVGPYYNKADNTYNIIRLFSRVSLPDSVQIRQMAVSGTDAKAQKSADSIMNAINAGAPFDSIAKKYNQPATQQWLTSAQYEGQTLDDNNRKFIETVTTSPAGSIQKVTLDGQGILIVNIMDRKNIIDKYDVAVVKTPLDFSKDTYNKAFNDFSSFLAGKNAADLEADAAKAGYQVQELQGIASTEHTVAGVNATRETLRWIFNEDTKIGDVSPLYECGDNDHLLVCVLTGIHKKGQLDWDDSLIKDYLTNQVLDDKKAAQIEEKMSSVNDIQAAARIQGAVLDTVRHISFASPAFIAKVGAAEPALSGSVSIAKQGDFKKGVRGNRAVYAYKVLSTTKQKEVKYDKKVEEMQLNQMAMRGLSNFTQDLMRKADIQDNRYLFY